jgi:ABC-type branched-subunit amino acid transport system ATPase component
VVTIALLLMLRNLATALGGPYQRTPGTNLPTVMLGPLPESGARLAAAACALAAMALFYLLLKTTWLGLAIRASAQSRVGAQTAGVDIFRMDRIAFDIGVALAGFAGALLAPVFLVYPTNGIVTTTKGFEIIVIGGLGSIPGALIAGLMLGVVETLGASFLAPAYQNAHGFILLLIVLLIRPSGLFGERVRDSGNVRITKRFGGFVAVNDVDLRVCAGEIRGIIGPNGAGKTTLVNLITGIYPPSAGDVRLDGASLLGRAPHRIAGAGLMRSFQVSRLFGNLTLLENLLIPYLALARGAERAAGEERAWRFLELTRLGTAAHDLAKTLSGGQRALLQTAVGFMNPSLKCYVLDEPFAGINPVIKESILALIEHENRVRALTFVIVTHETALVRRLCGRVTVMMGGRIAAEDTLDEIARRHDVIAGYLGKAGA